jgi:hypothetical protein
MSRKLQAVGNEGNPNKVGDFNKDVKIGSALKQGAMTRVVAVASDTAVLPESGKALALVAVFVSAGGATGVFTPTTGAPAAGEVAIDPITGNVIFNAADAVTEAEITYTTFEGDVVEAAGVADAAGLVTLPGGSRGRLLLEASVGGAARTVVARAAAPAAGEAALTAAGTGVQFNVADAGGAAVVKYVEMPDSTALDRLLGDVDY